MAYLFFSMIKNPVYNPINYSISLKHNADNIADVTAIGIESERKPPITKIANEKAPIVDDEVAEKNDVVTSLPQKEKAKKGEDPLLECVVSPIPIPVVLAEKETTDNVKFETTGPVVNYDYKIVEHDEVWNDGFAGGNDEISKEIPQKEKLSLHEGTCTSDLLRKKKILTINLDNQNAKESSVEIKVPKEKNYTQVEYSGIQNIQVQPSFIEDTPIIQDKPDFESIPITSESVEETARGTSILVFRN